MKNKLWTLLALLLCNAPAFSQVSDYGVYKGQFGIISSPSLQYLFRNTSLPIGLIYKFQVKPEQAWRISALISLKKETIPNFDTRGAGTLRVESTSFSFQPMLGYEWQNKLNNKWILYYGMDLGFRYSKFGFDVEMLNYGENFSSYSFGFTNTTSNTCLLQPLAGIKFRIHPKLFVATETKIGLSYGNEKDNTINTTISPDKTILSDRYTIKKNIYNFTYYPLANIQLLYQF